VAEDDQYSVQPCDRKSGHLIACHVTLAGMAWGNDVYEVQTIVYVTARLAGTRARDSLFGDTPVLRSR
jgi:hypothetical protein